MSIDNIASTIIALFGVFLVVSVICSHINEVISGFINSRGRILYNSLNDTLGSVVVKEVYDHKLISSIHAKRVAENFTGRGASYIEPSIFSRVIVDLYGREESNVKNVEVFQFLKTEADAEGASFAVKIEEWFKAANDRLTGTYTRRTSVWLFGIGVLLAVTLDLDAIEIARGLSTDVEIQSKVDRISKLMQGAAAAEGGDQSALAKELSKLLPPREGNGSLFGWSGQEPDAGLGGWVFQALGWALTGIAASLGSQFWFRMLGEALKLRQVGRKPSDEPENGAELGDGAPEPASRPAQGVDPATEGAVIADSEPDEDFEAPLVAAKLVTTMAKAKKLGHLSSKYEVSGRGPGVVSSGIGDPGGPSYGSYQMTSAGGGTVKAFVDETSYTKITSLRTLTPGTQEFSAEWRRIASEDPGGFFDAQHEYIKKTHYDKLVEKIKREDKVDVNSKTKALQNVVWSTAVQHGRSTSIFHRALAGLDSSKSDFERKLIKAIYAERGRKNVQGKLVYFSKSSAEVQKGVAARFVSEASDALNLLDAETDTVGA